MPPPPEVIDFGALAPEHLGEDATPEDLERFKRAVRLLHEAWPEFGPAWAILRVFDNGNGWREKIEYVFGRYGREPAPEAGPGE